MILAGIQRITDRQIDRLVYEVYGPTDQEINIIPAETAQFGAMPDRCRVV